MGITIGFRGTQPDPDLRQEAVSFGAAYATQMEWMVSPVDLQAPRARLGDRILELPRIGGISLLPHFASEPLPLVFLETTGELLDAYLQDDGDHGVRVHADPLTKTHFAGPQAHAEVCALLHALRDRFVPDLRVDDETGYFDHGDTVRLLKAFDEAWDASAAEAWERMPAPGEAFAVGGFPLRAPGDASALGEFDAVTPELRNVIEGLDAWVQQRYGGLGLVFDRSRGSVTDLDLLLREAELEGWLADPIDKDAEALAHGIGASFGRTLQALLGGHWDSEEQDGLILAGVGGVGLLVDPFQVVADRIQCGPSHGLEHHLDVYERLARHLGGQTS